MCCNRKKPNRMIFKCSFCNKFGHLESYYYEKLNDIRWYKGNNPRSPRMTNTPRLKTIWVPKVKNQYFLQDCFVVLNVLNEYLINLCKSCA